MAWTQEQINEIYMKVQQLATTDEEFRAELLKDSSAAIAKVAGQPLPDDFKVKIVENDPQYAATFVLPPMVSEELDDGDLDAVAGGACIFDFSDGCGARACGAKANPEISACGAKGEK